MTDVHPPPYYQPGDRVFIKSCENDWFIGRIYEVSACDPLGSVKLKGVEMWFPVDQLVPEHEVTPDQIGNLTFLPKCSDELLEMYKEEGLLFQKDENFVIEHKTAIERVFIPADICGGPTNKDHIKRLYEIIGGRTWMVAATVAGSGEYEISLYDGDEDERVFHHIEIEPEEIIPCPFRRWRQIFQVQTYFLGHE